MSAFQAEARRARSDDLGAAHLGPRHVELLLGGVEVVLNDHYDTDGFGALLVGYYEGGRLRYAGKVGTGYTDETLRRLEQRLRQLETLVQERQNGANAELVARLQRAESQLGDKKTPKRGAK